MFAQVRGGDGTNRRLGAAGFASCVLGSPRAFAGERHLGVPCREHLAPAGDD